MMAFMGPMILGLGSLFMNMFGGLFGVFFSPMWSMWTSWLGFTS